ncbi:MAG TPA: hypothetical protein PLN21_01070 [Gemmatales bacterium]|nr:hypothetical protein [Gemmatales bacterium]
MLHLKKYLIAGCIVTCLTLSSQAQETAAGPLVRWGTELGKSEAATTEALKKMAVELNDLKARLLLVEENQTKNHSNVKTQLQTMQDILKIMNGNYERLQNDFLAMKNATSTGVAQAGLVVPAAKKPIEEGNGTKIEPNTVDQPNKRQEDNTLAMQELTKLKQEVQFNSRDVIDLKKKYDALQIDFIQAQNDIGKLQQEMVKMNTRVDGVRAQSESSAYDRTRQSLALPTPPESQANAAAPRNNFGTLRFINLYPMTLTAIVDGQFFTLQPNQTLNLNKIPGYITYEVVGVQGNTLRTINAAETLTVQIVPR